MAGRRGSDSAPRTAAEYAELEAEVERLRTRIDHAMRALDADLPGEAWLALSDALRDEARFDAPGCQMCGAHEDDPCDCFDPQGGNG